MQKSTGRIAKFASAVLASSTLAMSGNTLTGEELIRDFSGTDRFNYIAGLVDMYSYEAVLENDRARAECITNWFFHSGSKAMNTVDQVLKTYPERQAAPIVVILANRECPKA